MNFKIKKLLALLLVLSMTLLIAACKSSSEEESKGPDSSQKPTETTPTETTPTVAFDGKINKADIPQEKLDTTLYVAVSVRSLTNPYLVTISNGMDMFCDYLDSIGQKYEKQVLICETSTEKQLDDIKAFLAKAKGNAILYVDPLESALAPAIADACENAGGYLVTAWNKPDDIGPADYSYWVSHHSPDNVISGYNTAKALFDFFGGKGNVLAVQGMLGNTAASDRYIGFEKALAEYPDVTLLDEQTANWDTKEALNVTETWLNKYPDVDGIWCANDAMATGVIQALDSKDLKGKVGVTGVDGNADIIEAILDGNAVATVSSNGFLQGGYSLAIGYAAWTGLMDVDSLPANRREFFTEGKLVYSDNVAEYKRDFVDGKPSYDFSDIWWCVVE